MSDESTPRLALPLLYAGQAQKELYHNEALTLVDVVMQAAVVAAGVETPPIDPEPGQCWLIGAAPEAAWAGHADAMACATAGGWRFVSPFEGMRVWIAEDAVFAVYSGGSWEIGTVHAAQVTIAGEQVLGARESAIADPDGGTVIDDEARVAIIAVLDALRSHGLIDPA